MTTSSTLRNALLIGAMTTAVTGFISPVQADDGPAGKEKCYGVVKAGKNDCKSGSHNCTGHATQDGEGLVFVPKDLCDKLVGGSTTPK